MSTETKHTFTKYQIFIIAILAILQFTIILDFMVLSPLGAILLKELHISTTQFGIVVSAYAFSAGASGLLAAGFADKFDRKKLLMFFYTGFLLGTFLCAISPNYEFLLAARIVTGIFGGVVGSIGFAIITDLFKMEVRGRVMGFVMMAFAASQVLGLPIGLMLANKFGWHSPFWMICAFGVVVGAVMMIYMKPIDEHLKIKSDRNPIQHLIKTLTTRDYVQGFVAGVLLSTGGFMLMPFGSAFSTNNLGLTMDDLPVVYGVTGICSILFGPLMGKLSDKIGKYPVFLIGTVLAMIMVSIYTRLEITPLWAVIVLNVVLFAGISGRMISAQALSSAIPAPQDRGAFMSINSSIAQISGGIAAACAGMIVVQRPDGWLERYDILGYVVLVSMVIAAYLMYGVNNLVKRKMAEQAAAKSTPAPPVTTEA